MPLNVTCDTAVESNSLIYMCHSLQESATYAHNLFQDLVQLFGRPLRIRYSHGGGTA